MYDLNLDVNDFPKKAATLEGNHLLSHLNGSSDLQQIDLDLAPLSLGSFKNQLDLVNGWEDPNHAVSPANSTTATSAPPPATKDILRLNTTPTLSKLINVRSPERCSSTVCDQATAKSKEDVSDPKSTVQSALKSKKNKKQQKLEAFLSEQNSNKPTKTAPSNETSKTNDCKEMTSSGSKPGGKQPQHCPENLRNGPRKAEECRSTKHPANGAVLNMQRVRGDAETRGRAEQESENKANHSFAANGHQQQQQQQQSKGKNKKNKNKGEKSSSAIGKLIYLLLQF